MTDLVEDLENLAQRCEQAAVASKLCDNDPKDALYDIRRRCRDQIERADRAWSRSWLGYHSRVYIVDLQPASPDEHFDPEWGLDGGMATRTIGRWQTHDAVYIRETLLRNAKVTRAELGRLEGDAQRLRAIFLAAQAEVLPTLDAALARSESTVVRGVRDKIEALKSHTSTRDVIATFRPQQVRSRDSLALSGGFQTPPHLELEAELLSQQTSGMQLEELGKLMRYLVTFLRKGMSMTATSKAQGNVFLGHGRSLLWRELASFLQDRLLLKWDEFNRESTAGHSTTKRLSDMLDGATFAFLVMTGEDEAADGKIHARANVIHEAGLFQGRLGFHRAILLVEDGCEEFSNVHGLTQLRFPKGNISSQFEEIRRVLEREKVITAPYVAASEKAREGDEVVAI
ncbi:MAG: nucleotide-binding protein [Polyangiaceae bacterium]|nr:nucleotide-binding protein [Polyangiaceae bacterium]